MTTSKLSDIVSPAFYDLHRQIKAGEVSSVVAKGGRGSTKSSWISIELILLLIKSSDCHAVVFRKIGNTLRNSVYAQCVWAIGALGLSSKFHCTVSPMEIVYKSTGQKIFFLGLDDSAKAKSIKTPFGYIGIAWFEELDQFAGQEEIRNVEQSVFRGGEKAIEFMSFNPPAMARNWANRYVLEQRPGQIIHHSTFLTTPHIWLGNKFLSDAKHLEETNPTAYRHEYLGEVVGTGTAVFENLADEQITDKEIAVFDRLYYGVDWGWYPDPWAYNAMHYDAAKRELWIFDELTRRKTSNKDTAQLLMSKSITEKITADSAEQKSISDYKSYGIRCVGAIKGPGSVEYGMKWLQSLNAIHIDVKRCPDTYKEFSEYEYEKDKQGVVIPGYPDLNNHHIDAIRYALEPVWRRKGQ